jgi:hypothetical protein
VVTSFLKAWGKNRQKLRNHQRPKIQNKNVYFFTLISFHQFQQMLEINAKKQKNQQSSANFDFSEVDPELFY